MKPRVVMKSSDDTAHDACAVLKAHIGYEAKLGSGYVSFQYKLQVFR
jgi:hypothetical protein